MGIWLIHDLFSGADDHRCWNQQIRASYGGPSKMGTFVISLKQSKNGGIKCRWTGAGFPAVQPVRLSTSLGNLPIPSFSCLSLDGVDACKRTQGNYLWNPVILSVNLKTICSIYSSALCPWEILTFQLRLGFYKAIPGLSCVIIDLRDHLSVEKWLGNIPCNGLFHMEINHILVGKTTQRCRRTRIPPKPHPWCGWFIKEPRTGQWPWFPRPIFSVPVLLPLTLVAGEASWDMAMERPVASEAVIQRGIYWLFRGYIQGYNY